MAANKSQSTNEQRPAIITVHSIISVWQPNLPDLFPQLAI